MNMNAIIESHSTTLWLDVSSDDMHLIDAVLLEARTLVVNGGEGTKNEFLCSCPVQPCVYPMELDTFSQPDLHKHKFGIHNCAPNKVVFSKERGLLCSSQLNFEVKQIHPILKLKC